MHPTLELLHGMRERTGQAHTEGIPDPTLLRFLESDPRLEGAIREAERAQHQLHRSQPELLRMDERSLCERLQENVLNFYPADGRSPYAPLAASGPWIVTSHGAVVHDSGGYGMLGLGHAPEAVVDVLSRPWPMANVMTPTVSQMAFTEALVAEIGQTGRGCPYERFAFLNSGSEGVALSARITDLHARLMTDPGGPKAGKQVRVASLEDSFHGRTWRPATLSHSCRDVYRKRLASFREGVAPVVIRPNDVDDLERAFTEVDEQGAWLEALYVEPVLGEGVPGLAITPSFYARAHDLCREHGTLLVVDSVQAGLRATGYLSIVDYPGFQDCPPPDMEIWSKAVNAGQVPLSVLGLTREAAQLYATGVYGNTMTANARALEVGRVVLEALTPELRENIREQGRHLLEGLVALRRDWPDVVQWATGTGLMVSAALDPSRVKVTGEGGLEEWLRLHGVHMIHGGDNGLRFTPPFDLTQEEVQLILGQVRVGIRELDYGRS